MKLKLDGSQEYSLKHLAERTRLAVLSRTLSDDDASVCSSSLDSSDDSELLVSFVDKEALAESLDRFKKRFQTLTALTASNDGEAESDEESNYHRRRWGNGRKSHHISRASDYLFDLSGHEIKDSEDIDDHEFKAVGPRAA